MGIRYWAVFAFSGALGLAGCGSDEQSNQGSTSYKGTIAAISADSTITINSEGQALTFDIEDVIVESDSDSDLTPGKVVTVEGTHDGEQGQAENIEYDSDVEGYVTAISTAADGTVTAIDVMGQMVIVDEMTMYGDGLSGAVDINVNDLIEVSGVFQDDHSILAKHIEYKVHGDIEIKGLVTTLVTEAGVTSFKIGTCTITVNAQTEFQDMGTVADLVEGMEVEVHSSVEPGSTMVDMTNGCNVIATKIELEDAREDVREFEFERGEVVSALVDGKFTLKVNHEIDMTKDIVIIINEETVFGGGGQADIVVGMMLRVQGNYDVDDNLIAKEIEFKSMTEAPKAQKGRFDAYVDAVDATAGTITVLGQMVMVNEMTMIAGHTTTQPEMEPPKTDMPVTETPATEVLAAADSEIPATLTLADIVAGDYVQIRFEKESTGMLIAFKLIVEQGIIGESSRVTGVVTAVDVSTDTINIEGVAISDVAALLPELTLDELLIGNEAFAIGTFADSVFTAKKLMVRIPEEPKMEEPKMEEIL